MAARCSGPTIIPMCLRAGDRNRVVLQLLQDGDPVDITGYTIEAMAREQAHDETPTLTGSIEIIDGPKGIFALEWGDARDALTGGDGTPWAGGWDLQVQDPGWSGPDTAAVGPATIDWDYTR